MVLGPLQQATRGLRKAGQSLMNDGLVLGPVAGTGAVLALSGMSDPNSTDSSERDAAEAIGAALGVPVGMALSVPAAATYARLAANRLGRPGGRLQNAMRLGLITGGGALGYGAGQALGGLPFSGAEHTNPAVRERRRLQEEALQAQVDYATQVLPLQEAAQRRALEAQTQAQVQQMAAQAIANVLLTQAQSSGTANAMLAQSILNA